LRVGVVYMRYGKFSGKILLLLLLELLLWIMISSADDPIYFSKVFFHWNVSAICGYINTHTHTHTRARARAHARTHARTHVRYWIDLKPWGTWFTKFITIVRTYFLFFSLSLSPSLHFSLNFLISSIHFTTSLSLSHPIFLFLLFYSCLFIYVIMCFLRLHKLCIF